MLKSQIHSLIVSFSIASLLDMAKLKRITSHVRKSYSNQDQCTEAKRDVPGENRINQRVNKT